MTHDELVLGAALSRVNKSIARYISRILDFDQGRTVYTRSLADMRNELADELAEAEDLLRKTFDSDSDENVAVRLVEGGIGTLAPHDCTRP